MKSIVASRTIDIPEGSKLNYKNLSFSEQKN